ncbi:Glutathione S-transferase [Chromobacterium violaceum]|uniref:Glutathione S-transferase n=1 Tax=Chromobacterium violaceum TaxID=536 RepID=A0A447TLP2_CHRVL|nr:Glutathione S-transferase [Chromobacterium violaceum]
MIKLHGIPLSPYYNKVKIALLEKGVNFQEVVATPSQEEALLEKSRWARFLSSRSTATRWPSPR